MVNPNEVFTQRLKLALGDLMFDKIQLIVENEVLKVEIEELKKVEADNKDQDE